MVDKEPKPHRPRRAFIEDDADQSAAEPENPAQASATPAGTDDPPATPIDEPNRPAAPAAPVVKGDPEPVVAPGSDAAQTPESPDARSGFPTLGPLLDDEDLPKPLYRDEVTPQSPSVVSGSATPAAAEQPSVETSVRAISFAPRRTPSFDGEETTILPRGRQSVRTGSTAVQLDDFDDDDTGRSTGSRARLALIIGAVAAVVTIGLVIGFTVLGIGRTPSTGPSPTTPSGSGAPASTDDPSGSSTNGSVKLLTDQMLLTPDEAKTLSAKRTWTIEKTQRGPAKDAPVPACFGGDAPEGQPIAQQEVSQLLSSSGKSAPVALHQASSYSSPEEATQAFAIAAKTLGSCAPAESYIAEGRTVSGVGDQSVGVIIATMQGSAPEPHSVVVARTGRVVNILDASSPQTAITVGKVAQTLAAITATQCTAAGGECGGTPSVKDGPPPLGGDEPGFLAVGDLPPAGDTVAEWTADAVDQPSSDFAGSSCEGIDWTTVAAESRASRVYLYPQSGNAFFGVNEIVLTVKDPQAANKLATKIQSNLASCKTRKLTAATTSPTKVSGKGAENVAVSGWTSVVTQKSGDGSSRYRVGVVTTGSKVVYTFLNPTGSYDFSDSQWNAIALRAGVRATQVN